MLSRPKPNSNLLSFKLQKGPEYNISCINNTNCIYFSTPTHVLFRKSLWRDISQFFSGSQRGQDEGVVLSQQADVTMFSALKGAMCFAASAMFMSKSCDKNNTTAPVDSTLPIPPSEFSPIIVVPGLGGSRLEASINKTTRVNLLCTLKQLKAAIWPPLKGAFPGIIKCWAENVKLLFDKLTGRVSDNSGVSVHVPGFGTTDKVEYLSDLKLPPAAYLHTLVEAAVKWGYVRDQNLKAAPYDFRKSPDLSGDYLKRLQELIESTYRDNGNKPITLIAHSLGAMHTLFFLQRQPTNWKQKFIKQYVVLGGPFGGAVQTIRALVSGYNFGVITVSNLDIREVQRTWPTIYFLLPKPGIGIWDQHPIVQREVHLLPQPVQYRADASDYKRMFRDMNYPEAFELYTRFDDVMDPRVSPGVSTHCIVGTGFKTPRTLKYKKQGDFPDKSPEDIVEDGDGTVITNSSNLCLQWQNGAPVVYREFSKAEHIGMVKDDRVIDYLKNLLTRRPKHN